MRISRALLIVVLLVSAIPAHAADLTIFGGLQRQGKITLKSATSGATDLLFNPRNFGVYGGRLALGLGKIPFLSQEHTVAVAPNFIDSNSKALIYNANLRIQAPMIIVKPYVTAGAGFIHSTGSTVSSIGTKFAINYGGGLRMTLIGPLGGRLDVRDYTIPRVQGQTLNVLEVTVGAVISF